MTLNEQIYTQRKRLGLSQDELAQMLEVSRQSVSKWENGTATPDLDKIIKLAEIFEISVDELVKGENSTPVQQKQTFPVRKVFGCIFFALALWSGILSLCGYYLDFFIMLTLPFAVCGIICFYVSNHTALYCAWTLFASTELTLRFSTIINWRVILSYTFYKTNYNVNVFITSLIEFIVLAILIVISVTQFSKKPVRDRNKCLKNTVTMGVVLIIIRACIAAISAMTYVYFIEQYIEFLTNYGKVYNILNSLIDYPCIILFIAVATNTVRLIKQRKK